MALERPLPTSSYVTLGLVQTRGPMTPYVLKKAIDSAVGTFGSFRAHSSLWIRNA